MWIAIAVVLVIGTGVLLILLSLAKRREHDLSSKVAEAVAAAQHAHARVQAVSSVEERYRGIMSIEAAVVELQAQYTTLEAGYVSRRAALELEAQSTTGELQRLRHELSALTDEEYFADFGLYSTRYDFPTSEGYKAALDMVRDRQKEMVKAGVAAVCHVPWTVEGSATKGAKMTADTLKMLLRAFNGECDSVITKVSYKNIAALEQRIWKAKERIDRLNAVNRCELTSQYVNLKIEELRLYYEYALKKEQERQEQRELKEQIREEKQAQRELEQVRKKAEAEEQRYATALAKAREEAQAAVGAKQTKMARKIAELEARLSEAQLNKARALSQAQLTRAGHVYIISNIGSFGEGVYKIGMTRRLDPEDRVKELGDASVPFLFDVHAFIKSNDAPSLEKALHRHFDDRRVNLVNHRKEFFRVSLEEIHAVAQAEHGEFELTKAVEASEYRQSMVIHSQKQHEAPVASRPRTPVATAMPITA